MTSPSIQYITEYGNRSSTSLRVSPRRTGRPHQALAEQQDRRRCERSRYAAGSRLRKHFVHGNKAGLASFNEKPTTLSLLEPEPLDLWLRQSIKARQQFARQACALSRVEVHCRSLQFIDCHTRITSRCSASSQ